MNTPDSTGQTLPLNENNEPLIHCYDADQPDQPCAICGGLGVIKYNVAVDHKYFGKLFRCPNNPIEIDEQHHQRMRKLSNLGAFADKSFDNFQIDDFGMSYHEKEINSLQTALRVAAHYADNPDGRWLVLEGTYGTGKTHLAAAVGNTRLERGDWVLFITAPDLLDHLRGSYSSTAEMSYNETFERLRDTELLIIDDLGVENPSEWAQEKLFQLLDYRYAHRKHTVITTNRDIDSLDPRIRSRLLDTQVIANVKIDAPDYRNRQGNTSQQLLSRLSMYSTMVFDEFDVRTNLTRDEQSRLATAANSAYEYAQSPLGWLFLTGTYGTGKTHLAAAIANYRRDEGDDVVLLTAPDLLDYLRTSFSKDSSTTLDRLLDQMRNTPLLVLDDLGVEASSQWAQEKLFQLLDYRYVGRLATVITTTKDIKDINPRIVTRLIDQRVCRMVNIDVPSYAMRMKRSTR